MSRQIISKPLRTGIGLIVLASVLLAGLETYQAFWNAPQLARDRRLVSHSFEVLATARGLEWAVRDAERSERNYVISGNAAHLTVHRAAIGRAPILLTELRRLTSDNAEQQARLPPLESLLTDKLGELRHIVEVQEKDGPSAALALMRDGLGADSMQAIGAAIATIVATEEKLLAERSAQAEASEGTARRTALSAALVAFTVLAMGALLITYAFRKLSRSEQALRDSEAQLRALVGGVTDYAIYMLDPQGRVMTWNEGAQRIKGYEASEIVGRHFSAFYTAEDREAGKPGAVLETARREGRYEAEALRVRKDGSQFWANVVIDALHDPRGRLLGFAKITRDITERHEHQEEVERMRQNLAQSQKMEALGQLTGGISHDLNNVLTVIKNATEVLRRRVAAGEREVGTYVDAIDRGADRAASLTQRLLAFARRQPLEPRPLDVNRLMPGLIDMLRRSLPETIAMETVAGAGLWWTQVDHNQLESAILNLALNAKDAMPRGGKLTVETANAFLDETYAAAHTEVKARQYVMIAVSDSGTGMPKEVAARVFEPFFTTKDVGQGTGLGLSQVFGFVKQSQGHIKIYSELGTGTTVKLYLPRLEKPVLTDPAIEVTPREKPEVKETILLVEDDDDVRGFVSESLGHLGYRVLVATDGPSALRILEAERSIDLLFTDVGLPNGMNGRVLADEAVRRRPGLKVLYTTGYARNAIIHQGRLDPGVNLITKPYTQTALAEKIREVLGSD